MSNQLYKVPTRDLVNELMRREGAQVLFVRPYDSVKLTLLEAVTTGPGGELMSKPIQQEEFTGPCVLVKVLD